MPIASGSLSPQHKHPALGYTSPNVMLYELSPAAVRRFYDDGFLIIEDLFSREEVAEMAEAAERLRAVGRGIAESLPVTDEPGERKIEHLGSQFVFGGSNGSCRLQRVVWAGGCEPAFLDCARDVR